MGAVQKTFLISVLLLIECQFYFFNCKCSKCSEALAKTVAK